VDRISLRRAARIVPVHRSVGVGGLYSPLKEQSPSVFDSSSSVLTVMTLAPLGCAQARLEDISTAIREAADTIAAGLKVLEDAVIYFSLPVGRSGGFPSVSGNERSIHPNYPERIPKWTIFLDDLVSNRPLRAKPGYHYAQGRGGL
jgi:hypothetical protein